MTIQESGYSFLATGDLTLTNFSTVDQVVYISDGVPRGQKGIIRDLGIIFTNVGGSVYLAKRFKSGSDLRLTGNLSDTATGLGGIVLDEGEKIIIKIGVAGSGVISAYDDGVLQEKINPTIQFAPIISPELSLRGGF